MDGFLDIVASKVTERFGDNISEYIFVLPGKRAYQILREKIALNAKKVCWEPKFTTLTKLMSDYSHIERADDIVLLAKLFNICRENLGDIVEDNFDSFESWGRILIQDFSGIDCGMVNAKELFDNVSDLESIDSIFKDLDQELESESILKNHPHPGKSQYKEKFDKLWKHLYDVYMLFRESLLESGIGYTGMISRKAAEDAKDTTDRDKKYVFVGFNTFNEAEYQFIKAINPEAVYWDEYRFFDEQQANKSLNPDGSDIRKIGCAIEESIKAPDDIVRKIDVIQCPTDTIQCKVVRDCLKSMSNVGNETAIVLADDALLPIMLQSIPNNITEINITTGRPISDSKAYVFFQRLKSIILERRENSFLRKDIEFILGYPCLKKRWADSESIIVLKEKLARNLAPIIDVSDVDDIAFKVFFKEITDVGKYLMERLGDLSSAAEDNELTEAAAKMCKSIETLSTITKRYDITLSKPLFLNMLEKSFARGYSPYETDAMSGLQITGILETRCQDFKNLFILSADDDTLPKKSQLLSFIPSGLRNHYRLPMSGDFQKMAASYFYHLLMRAENITILYNNNSGDSRSGEASRFIQQIRYLTPENTYLTFKTVTSSLKTEEGGKTKFFHSPEAEKIISSMPYSASMINTYLTCKKKFALRYIYNIKVPEVVTNDFKPTDCGTAVHNTLEKLCYVKKENEEERNGKERNGKERNEEERNEEERNEKEGNGKERNEKEEVVYSKTRAKEILADFSGIAMPIIESVGFNYIHEKYPHLKDSGEMHRLENLISTQVRNVIEYDATHDEFTTNAVEEPCGSDIGFNMKIDRRDTMANGNIRIVDYKSGRKENLTLINLQGKDTSEKISKIFKQDGNRYKKSDPILQTLLYGIAINSEKIVPAIYSLPLMSDPNFSPYLDNSENPIPKEYIEEFRKKLQETIDEMKNPDSSLEYEEMQGAGGLQSHCNLCDFKLFCGY